MIEGIERGEISLAYQRVLGGAFVRKIFAIARQAVQGGDRIKLHRPDGKHPTDAYPPRKMPQVDPIEQLAEATGSDWPSLRRASDLSAKTRAELRESLKGIDSEDTSIVVNGSLARDEYTEGSDIDWTLLIDGTADPGHFHVLGRVQEIVGKVEGKRPGAEGTFGAMVFSHNLVHEIGGEDDTNINLTRRLLLLLESSSVGRPDAHDRVVRNILSRYLLEDRGFWAGSRYRVPRFLQNDFARYWRTMAVDFAYKLRKRSGKGWAIRNMKLRMSRKLIYVSGLLACFRCHSAYGREAWAELTATMDGKMKIVDEMELVFARTPLSILAGELARHEHLGGAAAAILTAYDEFLGLLANQETRDRLEELEEEAAGTDKVYQQARDCSHRFRDGLLELFFDEQSGLGELTRNYGVF